VKPIYDLNRSSAQALVSFKKYMPPPLPYFKVNICPLHLSHFASIFFAYYPLANEVAKGYSNASVCEKKMK
jgi:hypothetical protein